MIKDTLAAPRGLVPPARATEAVRPRRASGIARREWTTLSTLAVTSTEHRTLTKLCAQASVGLDPPVDSSEILRALVRVMRKSEELRHWVRDELVRSRSASKPEDWRLDGSCPMATGLTADRGGVPAQVVVLSRRGRHRAPPAR